MMKKALGLFPFLIFFTFSVVRAQSSSARAQSSLAPAQPSGSVAAQDTAAVAFTGEKTTWHGYDRYDFVMDEATLSITPFKAPQDEGDGVLQSTVLVRQRPGH